MAKIQIRGWRFLAWGIGIVFFLTPGGATSRGTTRGCTFSSGWAQDSSGVGAKNFSPLRKEIPRPPGTSPGKGKNTPPLQGKNPLPEGNEKNPAPEKAQAGHQPNAENLFKKAISRLHSLKGYHVQLTASVSYGEAGSGTYQIQAAITFQNPDLSLAKIQATGDSQLTTVWKGDKQLVYWPAQNEWQDPQDAGILIPAQHLLEHQRLFDLCRPYLDQARLQEKEKDWLLTFTPQQKKKDLSTLFQSLNIPVEHIVWDRSRIKVSLTLDKKTGLPQSISIPFSLSLPQDGPTEAPWKIVGHQPPVVRGRSPEHRGTGAQEESGSRGVGESGSQPSTAGVTVQGQIQVSIFDVDKNLEISLPPGIRKYLGVQ